MLYLKRLSAWEPYTLLMISLTPTPHILLQEVHGCHSAHEESIAGNFCQLFSLRTINTADATPRKSEMYLALGTIGHPLIETVYVWLWLSQYIPALTFRTCIVCSWATFLSLDRTPQIRATPGPSTFRSQTNPLSYTDPFSPATLRTLWPCTPTRPLSVQNWKETIIHGLQVCIAFIKTTMSDCLHSVYVMFFLKGHIGCYWNQI